MRLKLLRKISAGNFINIHIKKKNSILKKIQGYEIVVHIILFDLLLSLNEDKFHCNMSNSLGAMIF